MLNDTITPPVRMREDHWAIVIRRGRAGREQPRESTPKALGQLNGQPGTIPDRAASGEAKLDHEGGSRGGEWGLGPLGISDYDGPETIRFRKYATGTHVLLEEIGVETGGTPREVVWTKNKAKLYRYRCADGGATGKRRPVLVLLIYGFVLKPYVLDLVAGATA